ncbi:hypothetical protein LG299_02300 [Microbacterium lacus]|uniref:hypothetical protein n=1 Tax=Microbacterium lacus TaxID=415217 RepID=UPI00384B514C
MPALLQPADPVTRAETLRHALHGQNAPLHVQYTFQLLHVLPAHVITDPGSREFRAAQRDYWRGQGILLDATRREISQGVHTLARLGLIPALLERGRHDRG